MVRRVGELETAEFDREPWVRFVQRIAPREVDAHLESGQIVDKRDGRWLLALGSEAGYSEVCINQYPNIA
jgi:hypothetical protein